MDFLQKYFLVFLNSPYRETRKNELKKNKEKKVGRWVGGWVWDLAHVRGGPSIFFAGPSASDGLTYQKGQGADVLLSTSRGKHKQNKKQNKNAHVYVPNP
jgi:hypothetical protein